MAYNEFVLYSLCGVMFKKATKLNWPNRFQVDNRQF